MTRSERHLVIDGLNLTHGGGVVVMMRLAHAFKTAGYRVTVLTARILPENNLAASGIDYLVKNEATGAFRSLLFRQCRLNRLVKEIGADFLISFNYHSPVSIPQVTYHINVIPFLGFHARKTAVGWVRAVMQNRMATAALRRSTVNLFESKHVLELAQHAAPAIRNPGVVYIGVEFVNQAPADPVDRLSGPFITITSGARHKRNDLTIAFFRKLLNADPRAKLEFVGDAEAIRAGLSKKDRHFVDGCDAVNFGGYIDRRGVFELLARARGLVTFSELESFFMVGVEAMAVGCPVIGADNSSIRESLGSAGLLVPPGDVDAAVDAALGLRSKDSFQRLEKQGRTWARQFDAASCASEFVRIFERGMHLNAENGQERDSE